MVKFVKPRKKAGVVGVVDKTGVVGVVNDESATPTTPTLPGGKPSGESSPVNKSLTTPPPPGSAGVVGVVKDGVTTPTTPTMATTPTTPPALADYTCEWAIEYYMKNGKQHILRSILVCVKPKDVRVTADLENVYAFKTFDVKFVDGEKIYNTLKELRDDIGKHPTNEIINDTIKRLMDRFTPIEIKRLEDVVDKAVYSEIAKDPLEWLKKKLAPLGEYRFRQALAVILSGVSTFLPLAYRLHTAHSGLSNTGKTTTINKASSIFPSVILQNQFNEIPEEVVGKGVRLSVSYVTPKSLVYLKLDWTNKVLVIDQVDTPEDIAMLRVLMTNKLDDSTALTVQGEKMKTTMSLEIKGLNPAVIFSVVLRSINAKSNQTYNRMLLISYDPLPTFKEIPELFDDKDRFAFLLWLKTTLTPVMTPEIENKINEQFKSISPIVKAGVMSLAKLRGHKEVTDDDFNIFVDLYRQDLLLTMYGLDLIDVYIMLGKKVDIPLDEYELRLKNLMNTRLIEVVSDADEVQDANITFKDKDGKIRRYRFNKKADRILQYVNVVPSELDDEEELVRKYFGKKGYSDVVPTELVKEALHELGSERCDKDAVLEYFAERGYPNANIDAIMKAWGCGKVDEVIRALSEPEVAEVKCKDTAIKFKLKELGIEPTQELVDTIKAKMGCAEVKEPPAPTNLKPAKDSALEKVAKELSNEKMKCSDSLIASKLKENGIEPTQQRVWTVKVMLGCAPDAIQTSKGVIQDPGYWRDYIKNNFDHNVFTTQQFAWEGASINDLRTLLEMFAEAGIIEKVGEDQWRLKQ